MVKHWKSKGIKVHVLTPDEKKLWVERIGHTLPVWDSFKKKYGATLYEQLAKMAS
jgi:hypothetical protein